MTAFPYPGGNMLARQPLNLFAVSLMLVLCVLWGLQQVVLKVAAPDMGTVMQLGVRSAVAGFLVCLLIAWRRETLSLSDGRLAPGLIAGVLFAVEFLCIAKGLQYTTASHMSVFLYTAPVFTVLGLHWLVPGERLGRLQWAGVVAAFAGIAVAFSNGLLNPGSAWRDMLIGDALGVLAGVFWAATTLLIRRSALAEAPPAITLLYQLGASGIILLLVAWASGEAAGASWTPVVWGSLVYQSVLIAFASYLVWFWMLRRFLASRLSVFSFLTPLFGVAFGVLLLNDPLDPRFSAGAVLVMIGVVLVNLRAKATA
jgi:drug/metabolite transporter (DMT)-like permease